MLMRNCFFLCTNKIMRNQGSIVFPYVPQAVSGMTMLVVTESVMCINRGEHLTGSQTTS